MKTEIAAAKEPRYKKLRIFNGVMAVLHAISGVAMVALSNDFSLPLTTSFVKFNAAAMKLTPNTETIWDLRLGPVVAAFLFLSAIAHVLLTLPGIYQWYVKNLTKGINYARWIEYSISSSLMIVVISMLVGMYDAISLMFAFFLNMMMILFGMLMEVHNQTTKKTNWLSYWFGCLAGIIPWVAVGLYLFLSGDGENRAPTFVYWIFFSIFVFFNTFAVNMILQYKKIGKWEDYLYGEYTYIVLSLVAKTLLAWQVWAGTLRPV